MPMEKRPVPRYTVAFYTLGCRVNQYETRAVEEAFVNKGFLIGSFDEKCDVYVINTCTVTAESDRKSRQIIRRARKVGGKDALVLAMGCMVAVSPEEAARIHGLDLAIGNRDKTALADAALSLLQQKGKAVTDTQNASMTALFDEDTSVRMQVTGSDRARAFLKIADGCDNHCSYCIIPKARGEVRSKSESDICDEVRTLVRAGYKEVVLTGIETAAYGRDTGGDLITLIEQVSALGDDTPVRIRLGSLEPTVIKADSAARLCACAPVCPHFHLSLQSGSDRVLAAMRRKYNTQMFYTVTERLRAAFPDVTLTTDIIVGFPGETEEMFLETVDFVRRVGFLYVHIFPYSDREGTEASLRTDKLEEAVKKERAARLKSVMLEVRKTQLERFIGTVRPVLVEKVENKIAIGHTDNFIETHIDVRTHPEITENCIVSAQLLAYDAALTHISAILAKGEDVH